MADTEVGAMSGVDAGTARINQVIAVIPARGGSRGISRKNLRALDGRPLLWHSIHVARECGIFKRVVVDTDDTEITEVASRYGAEVHHRDPRLARDEVHSYEVVKAFCTTLSAPERCDVCMLLPTSPLRTARSVHESYSVFVSSHRRFPVISVFDTGKKEQHLRFIQGDSLAPVVPGATGNQQRDVGRKVYCLNGSIYWWTAAQVLTNQTFHVAGARPYVMAAGESLDIDDEESLVLADRVLTERRTR